MRMTMETGNKETNKLIVSVIMPAYNEEEYIEQALESACMQQGDFYVEVLVIDDGSVDRTKELVAGFEAKLKDKIKDKEALNAGFKVILLENKDKSGVADSRNIGIREASGKYVAFLDADDWWAQDKLRQQVEFMENNDAVLCATARELMNADGSSMNKIITIPEEITFNMLLRTNYIPCSSVLLKTEVAREFYMCHDELHEDYILWLRILKKYKTVYGINEPMLKNRMSKGGKSRNKFKSAKMQIGSYRVIGCGRIKSILYFCSYTINGIRKYGGKH